MTGKRFSLAVKAILLDDEARCLLIRRSRHNRAFVGAWEWPGGKLDPGESFDAAVLREAREETSLDIEITGLAGATRFEMATVQVILLCMEARVIRGQIRLSEEHDEFAWVPFSEFPSVDLPTQIKQFMLQYASRKANGRSSKVTQAA